MSNKARPERRTRSVAMIRKLVDARMEMLSLYNALAARKPFTEKSEVAELLGEFCSALVDYTANAHFQLYRYFAENRERRGDVLQIVDRIYPRIVDITQAVLDFNDKYDTEQQRHHLERLEADLSMLGELLARRIELEDQLLDILSGGQLERG
jgi:regulator of sigma D